MAKPYRDNVRKSSSLPLAAPLAVLAVLMAPQARAEWKLRPVVDLRETYTDNAAQAESGASQSQFITELTPSLSIANEGPRLKLSASVTEHLYAYSGNRPDNTNSSNLQLQANANAKLIQELLFLDSSASISQQSVSAFGPQVTSTNGYSNTNRAQVRTYRISPYLMHQFGTFATTDLRYSHDSVKAGNSGLGESSSDSLSLSIASGAAFNRFSWGLQYSRQDIEDTLAQKSRIEIASANVQYRIGQTLALTATGGYDRYDYEGLGDKTAGVSRTVGFYWTPSSRTSLRASVGKRYFGTTYALMSMHRSRNTVWSVNYDDNVMNSRDQFLRPSSIDTASMLDRLFSTNFPDPLERKQVVDAYIRANNLPASVADNINYFSNRFFRQRQLQASAAFNMPRTTAVVSANTTKRTALSTQQVDSVLLGSSLLNLNDDTSQKSGAVVVNYRLSPSSGIVLSFNKVTTDSLSTGVSNSSQSLSLGLTKQFRKKLSGSLDVRHNQSTAAATAMTALPGVRSYRENAVSASLSLQL